MEEKQIKSINDLTRDFLEGYIAKLPKEDKEKIKEYLEEHPSMNASGVFTLIRSYIYNTYFRTTPPLERKKGTFADTLQGLLNNNEE